MLAQGRSIVLDGTMSWLPYVQQTIEMVDPAPGESVIQSPSPLSVLKYTTVHTVIAAIEHVLMTSST